MYYVYVLRGPKQFYTGMTNDLKRKLLGASATSNRASKIATNISWGILLPYAARQFAKNGARCHTLDWLAVIHCHPHRTLSPLICRRRTPISRVEQHAARSHNDCKPRSDISRDLHTDDAQLSKPDDCRSRKRHRRDTGGCGGNSRRRR